MKKEGKKFRLNFCSPLFNYKPTHFLLNESAALVTLGTTFLLKFSFHKIEFSSLKVQYYVSVSVIREDTASTQ